MADKHPIVKDYEEHLLEEHEWDPEEIEDAIDEILRWGWVEIHDSEHELYSKDIYLYSIPDHVRKYPRGL